jgi:hypothetical protein
MPVETKETLEGARNRLITESKLEPELQWPAYINGIMDMYNAAKRLSDKKGAE